MSVNDAFKIAQSEHQAGRLIEAEGYYRRVLAAKPDHADALHLLGVLAFQAQHPAEARDLIARAIAIQPVSTAFYSNYSVVLTALGDYPAAMQAIGTALLRDPGNAEYLANQAETQKQMQADPLRDTITNPQRTDGFGAQFQTLIYSVIYAELNHKKFVYTPFQAMAHNYDNDPDYLKKKEDLVNFLPNFPVNPGIPQKILREDFIRFFESNLDACAASQSLKKIRQIFRMNKVVHKPPGISVVMHVRRPNKDDNRRDGTDTPDAIYLGIIKLLQDVVYKGKTLHIQIHSQGTPELFAAYQGIPNLTLRLEDSVEDSFTEMVFADVLVTSRSSLSYTAALLSEGEVYYLPFWHPPLRRWKVLG